MEKYAGGWNPAEQFSWNVQLWFGAPRGTLSRDDQAFIGEIFRSSTTFSCAQYRPDVD